MIIEYCKRSSIDSLVIDDLIRTKNSLVILGR
jgi:hypothetical protein